MTTIAVGMKTIDFFSLPQSLSTRTILETKRQYDITNGSPSNTPMVEPTKNVAYEPTEILRSRLVGKSGF